MWTTGRSKVKGKNYNNEALNYLQKTNRFVLSLFANINSVMKQGKVGYHVDPKNLLINYSDSTWNNICSIKLPLDIQNRQDFDETKYCIQDFLLECFYNYEYPFIEEGNVTLKMLALILGVDFRTVHSELDLLENAILEWFNGMYNIGNELAMTGKLKKSPGLKAMYERVREGL